MWSAVSVLRVTRLELRFGWLPFSLGEQFVERTSAAELSNE
jgi:hypothetical protein